MGKCVGQWAARTRKTWTESCPVWTAHGPRLNVAQPEIMFAALSETGKKTVECTSAERPASTHASEVY